MFFFPFIKQQMKERLKKKRKKDCGAADPFRYVFGDNVYFFFF